MDGITGLESQPRTRALIDAVLAVWPEHRAYLTKSFRARSASTVEATERTAKLLGRVQDDNLKTLSKAYRWVCDMLMAEELHFRRNGSYRCSTFAEVNEAVYQGSDMRTYVQGLLVTQVLWAQHARSMDFYLHKFLPSLPDQYRHLEVGPGHGILIYYAAFAERCASAAGWDISPVSVDVTRRCVRELGIETPVALEVRDVMEPPSDGERFDSIVISEVLEHLEDPRGALDNLRGLLTERGRLYVNVPVNAPAVDHIYLLRSPEEAIALVESAGFVIEETLFAPPAGYTLARARKLEASISVVISARRAG